jgi:hypothetical protein
MLEERYPLVQCSLPISFCSKSEVPTGPANAWKGHWRTGLRSPFRPATVVLASKTPPGLRAGS